jgi:hypothetical protein
MGKLILGSAVGSVNRPKMTNLFQLRFNRPLPRLIPAPR